MDRQEALLKLTQAGLEANYIKGSNGDFLGGESIQSNGEVSVYTNSFMILKNSESWIAALPGLGQTDIEIACSTLKEAVEAICDFYASEQTANELNH